MVIVMNDNALYFIWLSLLFPAGSEVPKRLLESFDNDPERIYHAAKEEYSGLGIPAEKTAVLQDKSLDGARRALHYCERERIGILTFADRFYPSRLRIIRNPPALLYYRGRPIDLDDNLCIAAVGTRTCTKRGYDNAYNISYGLAKRGAVTVSGLALGIDCACIKGTLDARGYAVGVLGCGIDRIYPEENKELFYQLSEKGLILTEFAPFAEPKGIHFPIRNRIISGISVAAAIFEADLTSGALITARHALEQGRKIYAVPGNIGDGAYGGSNDLIKSGAYVLTCADDIVNEYALLFPHRINDEPYGDAFVPAGEYRIRPAKRRDRPAVKKEPRFSPLKVSTRAPAETKPRSEPSVFPPADLSALSEIEKSIYALFPENPISADDIAVLGYSVGDVLSAFTMLEVFGLILCLPGGMYQKTNQNA